MWRTSSTGGLGAPLVRGPRAPVRADGDPLTMRRVGRYARFDEYEGTIPAMDSFMRHAQCYGIRFGHLRETRIPLDQITGFGPLWRSSWPGVMLMSQTRARAGEWLSSLFRADSPQAKGGVERRFQIVQIGLIKETRLADVATLEAAIGFCRGLSADLQPALLLGPAGPARRPALAPSCEPRAGPEPCIKIMVPAPGLDGGDTTGTSTSGPDECPGVTHVQVEERVDGTMRIHPPRRPLDFHAITARPVKAAAVKPVPRARQPVTPRPDHPWRTRLRPERTSHAAAAGT